MYIIKIINFLNTICACLAYWLTRFSAWRYWRLNDPCCSESDSDSATTAAAKIWMTWTTPKIAAFTWGICTSFNTWLRGPTQVFIKNGMSIGLVVFVQVKVWRLEMFQTVKWPSRSLKVIGIAPFDRPHMISGRQIWNTQLHLFQRYDLGQKIKITGHMILTTTITLSSQG